MRDALVRLTSDGTAFADLGVERILNHTGVARSTFYSRYGDKSGLLVALSDQTLARLYEGAKAWIRRGSDATREDVLGGMRQILHAYREDEPVMRAVAESTDPEVRAAYVAGVDGFTRAVTRMIRRGAREGRMRDVPGTETASVLAWATENTVRRAAVAPSAKRADALLAALGDVVWTTLFGAPDRG